MEFHPLANAFPLLEGEAFADLVESVKLHGVKVACWRYEGKILDGRNRYRAAMEAGIPVLKWETFEGTEGEARELVKLLNDTRRHNTIEERRENVRRLRELGLSTRAIAEQVGVSNKTVHQDLKAGVTPVTPAQLEQEEPTKVRGKDNKMHPATRAAKRTKPKAKTGPQETEPKAADPLDLTSLLAQLVALTETFNNGRGFWAGAKTLEDGKRWALADRIDELATVLRKRASSLRNS